MIGAVRPDGRWWARWERLGPEDRDHIVEELEDQVRGRVPSDAEIDRQVLSCYPRHVLLRITVSASHGPRVGFAFYAPGQLYPLDFTIDSLSDFNDIGLEIRAPEQAADYLRLATWAQAKDGERHHFVSDVSELALTAPLAPPAEARLRDVLSPLKLVESASDDPDESHRFRTSTLHAGTVEVVEWVVQPDGTIDRFVDGSVPSIDVPVRPDRVESDRYFMLVRETSLSADRFLRRLRGGPLHEVRVTEPVVLRDEVFTEPVTLTRVTFEEGLDFEGSRFEKSLTLEQCVFEGKLSLRAVTVQGPLRASGMRFHREGRRRDEGDLRKPSRFGQLVVDLDASGMRVEGTAFLEGLRCPHVVDLSRVHVGGDLRLGGARIGPARGPTLEPRRSFALRLDAAEIDGDVDFAFARVSGYEVVRDPDDRRLDEEVPCYSTPQMVVVGTIWARRLHVHGDMNLQGLRCEGDLALDGCTIGSELSPASWSADRRAIVLGDFSVTGAEIGGDVDVSGMWVGGDALFFSTRVEGSMFGRTNAVDGGRVLPLRVGGRLDLSGIRINDVDLEGAELGRIQVITGEIGRLTVKRGIVTGDRSPSTPDGAKPDGGGAAETRRIAEIPGHVGSITLWDLTIHKRLGLRTEIGDDVRLGNVTCGGELEFWTDRPAEDAAPGEVWATGHPIPDHRVRTTIDGDLVCTGLEVDGRAVLTNVDVSGRIVFKNCRIDQDLNFQSLGPDPASAETRTRTHCRHLDLELTSCGGDVDMTGLTVSGEEANVHARQLEVTGRILLARPLEGHGDLGEITRVPREHRVQAQITGDLDLSVASTAQLVLVGSSVGGIVNLERGRFRRLDVVEPRNLEKHNLSDIEVDRWEIEEEHLRAFLDDSMPFARDTYVKVERMLRNKAQEAEADRVYRAMRARAILEAKRERRERREARSDANAPEALTTRIGSAFSYQLRTTGSSLLGAVYGWGTLYWAPLLVLTVLLAPITWSVVAEPENIVATGGVPQAADLDWGADDAFWLTLRYHVPVVPLTVREEFRPSLDPAVLRIPGRGDGRAWFSAEDWATGVYLLNWILWPLFLVGLARRVVRETT
jgi:hypothetical protein